MIVVPLFAAVALATAAVVGNQNGGSARRAAKTALRGTVVLSPATPVCRMGQSCTRPLAGFKLAFSRKKVVAQTKTDRDGRYRVSLTPGTYSVTAPGHRGGLGRGLEPTRITVRPVLRARVDFTFDAGIR